MKFTSKRGDVSDAEVSGNYLRNFKNGTTTIRFLQEMDEWDKYREHYTLDGKSFPCIKGEGNCPGCNHENEKVSKSSRKYATNVYFVEPGLVLPVRIPITLAKRLETRAERNGNTLLTRDYVVIRKGSGMDTDYDVDQDEKYAIDTAAKLKEGADIDAILEANFREQWGDPEDYARGESKSSGFTADEVDAESRAKKAADDVPPTESSSQSASADDEEIDEEDLYKMSREQLEVVAMKVGVAFDGMTDTQLIRKIIVNAT